MSAPLRVGQILEGVSPADMSALADEGRSLEFDVNGSTLLNGDTGISAGVKDESASIMGQPKIIPVFAIVAPVFFLMVVGFLEFGRALMVQQVLINASRVGARQAITTDATTAEVESAVQDYAAGVAVPGVVVAVSPDPSSAAPGTMITVNTSVAFSEVSWMASPWFLGGTTLTASSVMRKEGFE